MPKGCLALVLHAHLPYVRHPEYETFLEERWFFEATTETYIPIIKVLNRLIDEGVSFKLTISISPSLLAMMEDGLLQERYLAHLCRLIELSEKELERTRHEPHFNRLAQMYRRLFMEAREIFVNHCNGKLTSSFKRFHESGTIELITTSATHGLLPLLSPQPKAVSSQIITGLKYFESIFGFRPHGMWLPECGYYPGLDAMLQKEGIRFFVLESHGIEHASTTPFYGVHAPIYTPSGVAAFGRDRASTENGRRPVEPGGLATAKGLHHSHVGSRSGRADQPGHRLGADLADGYRGVLPPVSDGATTATLALEHVAVCPQWPV